MLFKRDRTILELLQDYRDAKFPESVDFDQNVMKKPHEHFKDNSTFAVLMYKLFLNICEFDEEFDVEYGKLETHRERTQMILEQEASRNVLKNFLDQFEDEVLKCLKVPRKCKSKERAAELRRDGNRHFAKKEFHKALECYNEVGSERSKKF